MGNFAPNNNILLTCQVCRGSGRDSIDPGIACLACDAYRFKQSVMKYEDLYALVDACLDDNLLPVVIANEVRTLLDVSAVESIRLYVLALYHLKEVTRSDRYNRFINAAARYWGYRKDPRRDEGFN